MTSLITVTATNGKSTLVRARSIHGDRRDQHPVYAITQRQYRDALRRISDRPGDWLGFGPYDVRVV